MAGPHAEPAAEVASPIGKFAGLLWVLSKKNFQVRYRRAVLGVGWAMGQPALQAAVLAFVFTRVIDFEPVPDYLLYMLSGVMPWAFFSQGLSVATTSIVENGSLVKKVAVPQVLFPASAVGGSAIAFSGPLVILLVAAVVTGHAGPNLLLLIPAVVLHLLLVVVAGLITATYFVAFRDVKYLVESGMLIAFYATPVVYALENLSGWMRDAIRFNPMTGVLSLYRAAVLERPIDAMSVGAAVGVIGVLALIGMLAFRSRSAEFADLL